MVLRWDLPLGCCWYFGCFSWRCRRDCLRGCWVYYYLEYYCVLAIRSGCYTDSGWTNCRKYSDYYHSNSCRWGYDCSNVWFRCPVLRPSSSEYSLPNCWTAYARSNQNPKTSCPSLSDCSPLPLCSPKCWALIADSALAAHTDTAAYPCIGVAKIRRAHDRFIWSSGWDRSLQRWHSLSWMVWVRLVFRAKTRSCLWLLDWK